MARTGRHDGRVTAAVREAIRHSPESLRTLARRYGLNPKTVAKWRARESPDDLPRGPRQGHAAPLDPLVEALAIALRRHARLPLDDCLAAVRGVAPRLGRSTLHRCLQRHGLSGRIGRSDSREVGEACVAVHLLPCPADGGIARMWLAIARGSRFIVALPCTGDAVAGAVSLPSRLADAMPAPIDRFLIPAACRSPALDRICADLGIVCETGDDPAPLPPDTAGPGERQRAGERIAAFATRYNAGARLHVLGGLTPREAMARAVPTRKRADLRPMKLRDRFDLPARPDLAGLPRPARDRGATRALILAAAQRRLAQDGPEGLSLAEVARLAGVNRGTVYQHFATREALIEAAAEVVSQRLYDAVFTPLSAPAPDSPVAVAELTDRLASFAMENPELSRAWLLQVLSSPDPARDLFWRRYQGSSARFAQTDRAEPGIDSEVLSVIMLAGAFLWPVWARTQARRGEDLRPYARRFATECLRISMYGNLRAERYPDIARRLAPRTGGD